MALIAIPSKVTHRRSISVTTLPVARFLAPIRHLARRIAARRTLVRISRLSPRQIRDMGYDPETLYYTLIGSFDAVDMWERERRSDEEV